jgi:Tol biopolymer transport system component
LNGPLGEPTVSASEGTLVWLSTFPFMTHLVWLDRTGKETGLVPMTPGPYLGLSGSPDGRHALMTRRDPQTGSDFWLADLVRGTTTRFTSENGNEFFPAWTKDGSRVFFASNRNGPYESSRPVTGAGQEEAVLKSGQLKKWPMAVSPDGRSLLYVGGDPKTGDDLWILPLEGNRTPVPYLTSRFNESEGAISRDGRWCAYVSDESGRNEVYVQPFPTPGAKTQVSTGGALSAYWSLDGHELYCIASDGKLMVSEVKTQPEFSASLPRVLFRLTRDITDLTAAGDRLISLKPVGTQRASTLTVVLNWTAELKDK